MNCTDFSYLNPGYWTCSAMSGAAAGAKSFFQIDGNAIGKEFVGVISKAFSEFQGSGGAAGKGFSVEFQDFINRLDFPKIVEEISKAGDKSFKAGLDKAKVAENMADAAEELGKGLGKFREMFTGELGRSARDSALKSLPWLALASIVTVGTPLLVSYLYYKAKHNIGRPKLMVEERRVSLISKVKQGVTSTISGVWESVKPGVSLALKTAAAGTALAVTATLIDQFTPLGQTIPLDSAYGLLSNLGCVLGFSNNRTCSYSYDRYSYTYEHCYNAPCDYTYLNQLMGMALAVGGAATVYTAGKLAVNKLLGLTKKEPKAIFNPEVSAQIDNITKATYNLQRNGGYFQNILLYGPGGTGKTMISKMIAKNSNMNYVMMSGGDLAQYIKRGEHVTELNKLFKTAKDSSTPTILFIDEAESLCRDRDIMLKTNAKEELIELLNAFLNQTGESSKKIMLVLATNRLEDIDPAVLSRMDHKILIAPPQFAERVKILQEYVPMFFSAQEQKQFFTEESLNKISNLTEGLTGRAIFKMLNALMGNKNASEKNILTQEMIDKTITQFVAQERAVQQIKEGKKTVEPKQPVVTTPHRPSRPLMKKIA